MASTSVRTRAASRSLQTTNPQAVPSHRQVTQLPVLRWHLSGDLASDDFSYRPGDGLLAIRHITQNAEKCTMAAAQVVAQVCPGPLLLD